MFSDLAAWERENLVCIGEDGSLPAECRKEPSMGRLGNSKTLVKENQSIIWKSVTFANIMIAQKHIVSIAETGGALSGAARNACQTRIQAATNKKNRLKSENAWVSEMLSKYR